MADLTPNLGIKKPLATENVSRASINENWDIIDEKVAPRSIAQMFKLTKDDGQRNSLPLNTDITKLKSGQYYTTGTSISIPTMPISNDTSYYNLDVSEGGGMKQFFLRRNFDNRIWVGSIHTDSTFRGWYEEPHLTGDGILSVPKQSYAHINNSGTQSILSGVDTKLTFLTSEIFDVQSEFAGARFTAKEAGSYFIRGLADWGSATTGDLYLKIYRNGQYYTWLDARNNSRWLFGALAMKLDVGEYIELYTSQFSGAAKALQSANFMICKFA